MTFMERTIYNWAILGNVVREERRARDWTQAALAEHSGVSRGWLNRFEQGLDNAEPRTVLRVLRSLGLDIIVRPHRQTEDDDLLREVLGG
jgi:transcriptional regulator with XRE-family HTH domain